MLTGFGSQLDLGVNKVDHRNFQRVNCYPPHANQKRFHPKHGEVNWLSSLLYHGLVEEWSATFNVDYRYTSVVAKESCALL